MGREIDSRQSVFRKILVPFDDLYQLCQSFDLVLAMARELPAEVILVRVNLPLSPATHSVDVERLYTELKALQVQLPHCPVPIRVASAAGPVSEAALRYAEQHDLNVILFPTMTRSRVELDMETRRTDDDNQGAVAIMPA